MVYSDFYSYVVG